MGKEVCNLVSELKVGSMFEDVPFLLVSHAVKPKSTGGNFVDIQVTDRTGRIGGKIWSDSKVATLEDGCVFFMSGKVSSYRDVRQVEVSSFSLAGSDSFDPADFFKFSKEELNRRFLALSIFVANGFRKGGAGDHDSTPLSDLVTEILDRYEGEITLFPAASGKHHEYMGGLLVHTSEVLTLVDKFCSMYTDMDREVLCAAAILHDIGKVFELKFNGVSATYSKVGSLCGHIFLGSSLVHNKSLELKIDPSRARHLIHCILSHHGCKEWGSPVEPMTQEAQALHYADMVSSRLGSASWNQSSRDAVLGVDTDYESRVSDGS